MVSSVADRFGDEMRSTFERMVEFESTPGEEASFQAWFQDHLEGFGFDTVTWSADADELATHPSFPDDPAEIDVTDRPSVAGIVEFGNPDVGQTLVLNGHCDVVPVDLSSWSTEPFEASWDGNHVTARGAADMKGGLTACVFAAKHLMETATDLNGRIVVESVAGEEEGGIGAASAAISNPYPFDRDGAIIAEPTELRAVTAVEGSLMKRLELTGRSAHAAMRDQGESVLPHFFEIHEMLETLEAERSREIIHPLYESYDNPWPINVGTVNAGNWASSVPAELTAEVRIGVAPGETIEEVEQMVHRRLDALVEGTPWLREHPPRLERFSIQFEPAEVDLDDRIVTTLQASLKQHELDDTPIGATYGADSRHYLAAGIPTVVFGPGSIESAHFPNEQIDWNEVEQSASVIADAAAGFLDGIA